MKIHTLPVLMAGALWLAGCADGNWRPYALDDSFGRSANHLLTAQIADPQAAKHPQVNSPRKMDGYAGGNIMRTFRNGFGQDIQIQPPQQITIGNISGS
ncbi:MAG: hypothetical protein PHI13_13385, partial [Methylococcales bacterium]|nr:hypothetical protein [Methylococcales bacterium]